nr:MAG TPA: hypothetical protein [Caudoviricetes sp.]
MYTWHSLDVHWINISTFVYILLYKYSSIISYPLFDLYPTYMF